MATQVKFFVVALVNLKKFISHVVHEVRFLQSAHPTEQREQIEALALKKDPLGQPEVEPEGTIHLDAKSC